MTGAAERNRLLQMKEDELLSVIRTTVTQLEVLTTQLEGYVAHHEETPDVT